MGLYINDVTVLGGRTKAFVIKSVIIGGGVKNCSRLRDNRFKTQTDRHDKFVCKFF